MEDANTYRSRLTEKNPLTRVTVDQRRTGNAAHDGYAVLDQAHPNQDPWTGGSRNRRGLTQRVYDGPNIDYTE